jgi:hypothetical protein
VWVKLWTGGKAFYELENSSSNQPIGSLEIDYFSFENANGIGGCLSLI